jgi:hypothetical protein
VALDLALVASPFMASALADFYYGAFVALVATLVWIALVIKAFRERAPLVARVGLIISCPALFIALAAIVMYCWGHGCVGWPTDP